MKVVKRMPKGSTLLCAKWTALEPLLLPDNAVAKCAECGHAIQHRPHAPKKMRKLCMECGMLESQQHDVEAFTTKRMMDDFDTYLRKQKQ